MSQTAIEELLEPVTRCFTPEVAQQIAALRAAPAMQQHIDSLADKCSDGTLSEQERDEYESIVRALNFIGLLQAQARSVLAAAAE